MSVRTILMAVLAIASGLGAVWLVNAAIAGRLGNASAGPTVAVVVAAADIPRGGMVTTDLVSTQNFPKDLAPPGALTSVADAVDRAVLNPLVKGEPILEVKLAKKGAGRGLAAVVPPGMRAFTIRTLNVATGVAGFVLPGNRVDVLLTVTDSGTVGGMQTGGATTTTLLQNVEILAVDQNVDAPSENKVDPQNLRSVTLLVTPEQASKLELGQSKGTLSLTLRNLGDDRDAAARPVTLADLRFYQGRPLNEQARDVLNALGKMFATRPVPAKAAGPRPQAKVPVLTIRGRSTGVVHLQPGASRRADTQTQ